MVGWFVLLQQSDKANKKEVTMKVMVRTIMKAVPGKMAELVELEQKHTAIASRVLGVSGRFYRPLSGGGDTMNTIILEGEFDSLAAFEAHPQKMGADPEMQALMPKYEGIVESMEVEFYMPMP
jgi:hypothetical protein